MTGPGGTCQLEACPAVDGDGECLIGRTPISCENFDFDVDADPASPVSAPAAPPRNPVSAEPVGDRPWAPETPLPAQEFGQPSQAAAVDGPSSAPAAGPEPGPLATEAAGPAAAAGREPSRVPEPDGPRRLVDLTAEGVVALPSGLALTAAEAAGVLAAEDASTVVLAAPPDSGKSTLLAALYEAFCCGPVGAWTFAGSLTLLGFMRTAWYASSSSGRAAADTERTLLGVDRPWLHLRIGRDGAHRGTLLLADLSGEYFRNVGSGQPLGDAQAIAGRASHVVHFVDAGLFEAPTERVRAHHAAADRLRRLSEAGTFPDDALHTVVVSRADLCPSDYREALLDKVRGAAARWLPDAPLLALAARPGDDSPPSGLVPLLDALMRPAPGAPAPGAPAPLRPAVARIARAGVQAGRDGS